jgi:hypothetical protein
MVSKFRKQIYIDPAQEVVLKQLSSETGLSAAEIIRQAIDRYARSLHASRLDLSAWEKERAFIESLIEQGPVSGDRLWRRDDLHG